LKRRRGVNRGQSRWKNIRCAPTKALLGRSLHGYHPKKKFDNSDFGKMPPKIGFLLTARNHFRKVYSAEKGGGPDMIDQCTVCEVAET